MIGNLSLDQLLVLVTIADTGSFSATGRKLRRAQSAISQSVATLETLQGVTLFDRSGHRPRLTEVGRVLVAQARLVLASAAQFEAVAASTQAGVEAELKLVIDPLVPTAPLIESLRALSENFPHLAVTFSVEGLGGAQRRLRSGNAALAVCVLIPSVPEDVTAVALLSVNLIPVVAVSHSLAALQRPITRADLEQFVQLVLSDPIAPDSPSYGVAGGGQWRFVDLARRLDFLLAGFGWCRMPEHLIAEHLRTGRLVTLELAKDLANTPGTLTIYAAHLNNRLPGVAGRWLLNDLTTRLCS